MRLSEGASPEEVSSDLSRLRSSFAVQTAKLRAGLDASEEKVRALGLGGVAEERMLKARAAFEASHGAILERLETLESDAEAVTSKNVSGCSSLWSVPTGATC